MFGLAGPRSARLRLALSTSLSRYLTAPNAARSAPMPAPVLSSVQLPHGLPSRAPFPTPLPPHAACARRSARGHFHMRSALHLSWLEGCPMRIAVCLLQLLVTHIHESIHCVAWTAGPAHTRNPVVTVNLIANIIGTHNVLITPPSETKMVRCRLLGSGRNRWINPMFIGRLSLHSAR